MRKQIVNLTATDRAELLKVVKAGTCKTRTINRAHTLLMSDQGMTDQTIAEALHIGICTVERIRDRYVKGDLVTALTEKPRPGARRKLDAAQEAQLVAIACSQPPKGHQRWTNDLLAAELVRRKVVTSIARNTVYLTLKKTK